MKWLSLSLATLLAWGFWTFFLKLASKEDFLVTMFAHQIGGALVLLFVLLTRKHLLVTSPALIWGGLAGIVGMGSLFVFLGALGEGKTPLVVTLTALYPAVTIALSVLFLHETVTLRQWIGIALALIAIALMVR